MNDDIYEINYNNIIEPLYGELRNPQYDNLLISTNEYPHELTIDERVDFTMYDTYSIDPEGCEDADDAFSIYMEDHEQMYLAIHIADPTEYINIKSELWKDIIRRVTTKYPSNRHPIHMMPKNILNKASLMENNEGNIKKAITVLTRIDIYNFNPVGNIKLLFTNIKVKKENALNYKEAAGIFSLKNTLYYGMLISESLKMDRGKHTKGIQLNDVTNSYPKYDNPDGPYLYNDTSKERLMKQMIAEFAIFANSFVGEYLKIHLEGVGIFRTCAAKEWLNTIYSGTNGKELLNEIIINGIKAEYISSVESHDLVGAPEYCHFTSPIRRLSDCICHYLLKYIYLKNKKTVSLPFTHEQLERYSHLCFQVSKNMKKNQYKDIKFRLIQIMNRMLLYDNLTLQYFITSYTGMFLNIIIFKISDHNVHMSYTLRVKDYNYIHDPKKIYSVFIKKVNCFEKFDNGTIPELDEQILNKI